MARTQNTIRKEEAASAAENMENLPDKEGRRESRAEEIQIGLFCSSALRCYGAGFFVLSFCHLVTDVLVVWGSLYSSSLNNVFKFIK